MNLVHYLVEFNETMDENKIQEMQILEQRLAEFNSSEAGFSDGAGRNKFCFERA